jgi:hypothetical protein
MLTLPELRECLMASMKNFQREDLELLLLHMFMAVSVYSHSSFLCSEYVKDAVRHMMLDSGLTQSDVDECHSLADQLISDREKTSELKLRRN